MRLYGHVCSLCATMMCAAALAFTRTPENSKITNGRGRSASTRGRNAFSHRRMPDDVRLEGEFDLERSSSTDRPRFPSTGLCRENTRDWKHEMRVKRTRWCSGQICGLRMTESPRISD